MSHPGTEAPSQIKEALPVPKPKGMLGRIGLCLSLAPFVALVAVVLLKPG